MADRIPLPGREEAAAMLRGELDEDIGARIVVDLLRLAASGRLVDREAPEVMEKMWVCLFDGPNDLCEQGKMTSKHQELCGEFWPLPDREV